MKPSEIRTLRRRLQLSGNAFAAALGLAGKHRAAQVYKWEKGSKKPGPQTLLLMKMLKDGALKTK